MSKTLHLIITTPLEVLVDDAGVRSLRAEDASGSFGVLPGHVDFLTVLPASVVRWHDGQDHERYCAVRGGVFTVTEGEHVAIACREGTLGDDLERLESDVEELRTAEVEAGRQARVEQTRLHARAVRQLIRYLRPTRPGAFVPEQSDLGAAGGEEP